MTATIFNDEIEAGDRSSRREEPLPVVSPYLEHCGELNAQHVQYTVEKYREQISRAIHQHEDPEGVDTIIIDDFIYHGRTSGAATGTIDEFLRLHPELSPEDQALLESWKQAILGVFESIDFDHANCTLKALNLIDELEYKIALTIVDSEIMNAIKPGNFNLSRIVPVKDTWTFSGKLMPFDRADSRFAYAQAAELAMKHPAWFFRNPLHLKMAREKALKSHEKFLEQFDATWIAGPPAQIEARYRAFLSLSKNAETESSDVTSSSFAIRAKDQSKSAISQLKLPAALRRAKSVGMISHPEDGVYFELVLPYHIKECSMSRQKGSNIPRTIKDPGSFDFMQVSLDYNYRTIVGSDRNQVGNSIRVLSAASSHGRKDASVFLMGLLVSLPIDDWEMKIEVAKALEHTRNQACADLLFSEIRRVGSSNKSRTYLTTVINVLTRFPEEIKQPGFHALTADMSFTSKMRKKFAVLASDEEEESFSLRMLYDEDSLDF